MGLTCKNNLKIEKKLNNTTAGNMCPSFRRLSNPRLVEQNRQTEYWVTLGKKWVHSCKNGSPLGKWVRLGEKGHNIVKIGNT